MTLNWDLAYGHHADVSPDGSRIVYATCEYTYYSGTSGRYEIATANPDGTESAAADEKHKLRELPGLVSRRDPNRLHRELRFGE